MPLYQEEDDSVVMHEGVMYHVNTLLRLAGLVTYINVNSLLWCVNVHVLDSKRVDRADYRFPLIVFNGVVLDGAHRLANAVRHGVSTVPVHLITQETLVKSVLRKCDQ